MSFKLLADKYIELNVQGVRELTGEAFRQSKEESQHYTFLFCRSGTMRVRIDEKEYALEDSDILYAAPKSSFAVEQGNYSCIAVSFNGATADDLLQLSQLSAKTPMIHDDNSRLGYYFYKIYHSDHEAEYLSIMCLGILYELFYELTKQGRFAKTETSNQEKHIELAKEFINQNYQTEITIADVARKVGVTSNYLANIFTVYIKKTPKLYLTQVRMEQAKKLLATHKYKVKEVGNFVGYKNQLHFSSEFKKYTGKSPLQYSKEV